MISLLRVHASMLNIFNVNDRNSLIGYIKIPIVVLVCIQQTESHSTAAKKDTSKPV